MIRGVGWVGVRTEKFDEMRAWYAEVFGLAPAVDIPGMFALFDLPDGDRIEIFGAEAPFNQHFRDAPVAGFTVDDVDEAMAALEAKGVRFVFAGRDEKHGIAWAHFEAPDGNLYEITHRLARTRGIS